MLPLNSCANPFLYAIFTKQFKKDCNIICKKLEESALSRSLSRLSNRGNISLSWGSSRRPSALNSFFGDKRFSRSNSISGASASHHDHSSAGLMGGASSEGRAYSEGRIMYQSKRFNVDRFGKEIPIVVTNFLPSTSNAVCNGHMYGCQLSHSLGANREICSCHKGPGGLRVPGRGAPVGAGSGLLSMLKLKKDVDKIGDGMDSDQEDSNLWVPSKDSQDYLGVFPLTPMGDSPRGARKKRSPNGSPINPRHVKHVKIKSDPMTHGSKRSMNLNCCNGNPRTSDRSPGGEYQIMRSNDESSSFANYSTSNNESSVFDSNIVKNTEVDRDHGTNNNPSNNNHEYVNVTQEMIHQLQRIRNESSTSDSEERSSGAERSSGVDGRSSGALSVKKEHGEPSEDKVRVQPEGSESKIKSTVVKLDPLSAQPAAKRCKCNNPNCTDKLGERIEAPRQMTPSPDPLTMNRDTWIGSTENSLISPDDIPGKTLCLRDKRKMFCQKKSFSTDDDEGLKSPNNCTSEGAYSASMPLLFLHGHKSQMRPQKDPYSSSYSTLQNITNNLVISAGNVSESVPKLSHQAPFTTGPRSAFSYSRLQNQPAAAKVMNNSDSRLCYMNPKVNDNFTSSNSGGNLSLKAMCNDMDLNKMSHSQSTGDEVGLLKSFKLGGRVSPTETQIRSTEVRLTDSIPKVVLKQPSQGDECEDEASRI